MSNTADAWCNERLGQGHGRNEATLCPCWQLAAQRSKFKGTMMLEAVLRLQKRLGALRRKVLLPCAARDTLVQQQTFQFAISAGGIRDGWQLPPLQRLQWRAPRPGMLAVARAHGLVARPGLRVCCFSGPLNCRAEWRKSRGRDQHPLMPPLSTSDPPSRVPTIADEKAVINDIGLYYCYYFECHHRRCILCSLSDTPYRRL
jgi:hypothetical protein